MESHSPLFDDVVAIQFPAIVPRCFVREGGGQIEWFRVFVDVFVEPPFEATGTFPEFNGIILAFVEEPSQFIKNGHGMQLIWMRGAVKNVLCSIDGVSNDKDFGNIFLVASLFNVASNSK